MSDRYEVQEWFWFGWVLRRAFPDFAQAHAWATAPGLADRRIVKLTNGAVVWSKTDSYFCGVYVHPTR